MMWGISTHYSHVRLLHAKNLPQGLLHGGQLGVPACLGHWKAFPDLCHSSEFPYSLLSKNSLVMNYDILSTLYATTHFAVARGFKLSERN